MSFREDLKRFSVKVQTRNRDIFVGMTEEVQRSVVEGSEITNSPGQPVDTGALKASWIPEFTSPTEWQTSTNLVYAPVIEAGVGANGPLTLRSQVGGFHSVALTVAGAQAIADHVAKRVAQ